MTNATADNLDALVTAYVYGELSADAKTAFEEQMRSDPQLQAEVDGLMAMREVLDADAQFGSDSGLEDPPPHLFDAILKDEAIARSPAVKAAMAKHNAPPSEGLLSKLSTWLVGGGALAGAAAVLFYVVARPGSVAEVAAPVAAKNKAPATATQGPRPTAAMDQDAEKPPLQSALNNERSNEAVTEEERPQADMAPAEAKELKLAKGALQDPARPITITTGESDVANRKDGYVSGSGSVVGGPGGGGFAPEPEDDLRAKKRTSRRGGSDEAAPDARRSKDFAVVSDAIEADKAQGEKRAEEDGDLGLSFGARKFGIDTSVSLDDDDSTVQDEEVALQKPKPEPKPKPAAQPAREKAEVGATEGQMPSSKAKEDRTKTPARSSVSSVSSARGGSAADASTSDAPAEPPAAAPPPPPPGDGAGPPRLNERTSEFARKQRQAAAKKAPKKAKRSKNNRDSFKAKAKREARLRTVEQTIMAAATELSAQRSATALALFQRAELEGSGLKEIGLGPVLGQMQSLLQMNRKKEALALARKGERAAKGTIGKDDVIATGARVATQLQNRPRARSLWRQLLNSPRFKAEAKRGLRALEFDADMFESEAPAVRSRR